MRATFAAQYRAIVGPRIRQMCRWHGLKISLEEQRFTVASGAIIAEAYRLGAAHLPEDVREGLPDRIADWLIEAIESADDLQISFKTIWDDIAETERRFLATLPRAAASWPGRSIP